MSKVPNGLYKLTMYLRPDQYEWLRVQALKVVVEDGGGRPDVSAILRVMIDKTRADLEEVNKPSRRRK